jgi:hypothetical protein
VLGYSERTHSPRLYVNYVLSIFDINSNPQEHVPCSKVLMYRSSKSWAELYGPLFQPPRMLEGKQDHVTSRWSVALHPPCDFDSILGKTEDCASTGVNKLLARSCTLRQTHNEVAFRDSACASHTKIHVWLPYHWPLHRFRNGAIKFGATINPNVAHFKPGWHRVLQLLPLPAKAVTKRIPATTCHSSTPGKRLLPCRSIRRNRTFQTTRWNL